VRALGGLDVEMDGVIVTVVHDEFRGMGLRGFVGIMDEGAAVVDVRGMRRRGWGFVIWGCETNVTSLSLWQVFYSISNVLG
jgi:hypothetical protein